MANTTFTGPVLSVKEVRHIDEAIPVAGNEGLYRKIPGHRKAKGPENEMIPLADEGLQTTTRPP